MTKPDEIDFIVQLILAICDFWVTKTLPVGPQKFFSTRNFHQKFFSTSGEDVHRGALLKLNVIKIEWKSAL